MKTFPTNFVTEKNKKTGASPVWILKIPFTTGALYLSDRVFSVASWNSGVTTKSWVKTWGEIDENIVSQIAAPHVADFTIAVIDDPNDTSNIGALLWDAANKPETTDCELYLWFLDLNPATDPPQKMFVGNIVDFDQEDELVYRLYLVDQSVRYDKYVGIAIDTTTYPNADPDDIGKIGNIGYGVLKEAPAMSVVAGALDYLDAAITAAQTTLNLIDASRFPASGSIGIDNEDITYTGKNGNQLTGLVRGVNSTTAVIHNRGTPVWEERTDFTYEAFSHPIKQFDNVYAFGNNTKIKITSICTTYTGNTGSQHPTWPNKAMVVIPAKITKIQAVNILTEDGISLQDAQTIIDNITVNDQTTVKDLLTVGDNIAVSQGSHAHTVGGGIVAVINPYSASAYFSYTGQPATRVDVCITQASSNLTATIDGNTLNSDSMKRTQKFTRSSTTVPTSITINVPSHTTQGGDLVTYEVWLEVYTNATDESAATGVVETGNAYRTGTVTKSGMATKTGTATLTGTITKTGTITLSGNSVADTVIADQIVVDAQGYRDDASGTYTGVANSLIERPGHVIKHLLVVYGGWPVANFYTNANTYFTSKNYTFAGVITEKKKLKEWLTLLAFQCRCYFRIANGTAQLLWRPDTLSSQKTITSNMIRMQDNAKTTRKLSRSLLDEVVNKIEIH
ncbi:MAG: hypothetical protein HZB37_11930, partial [Planctomycetes bacterium]|nr:hypothetical protein [Planctomycetota bacterium]